MTILTTAYNCEKYIPNCLESLMNQTYKNFHCYITDDLSTDNTCEIVESIIKNDDRFTLIRNEKKLYQVGNYDNIIRQGNLDDDEICVEVDGDDWLAHPNVLSKVQEIYDNENIWMTSGSFKYQDGRNGFASLPSFETDIRTQFFTLSHLRTWKSWLWKKILIEDLKDENGNYWDVAGDLAFMFPMFDMSGEKKYKYIEDILYIYNEQNPLNDHKVNLSKVREIIGKIKNKSPYQKI